MKSMRKILLLFFILIFVSCKALAFNLTLPTEKKFTVNSQYAFFVGKANKTEAITINDEKIHVASNGAFAHSVKLKDGENRIIIRSNFSRTIYKIYKNKSLPLEKPQLIEFEPANYIVLKDNTPLRNTPIDYGMNRISHLFKDTNLIINGEQGEFYRVFLSKDKTAWIAKNAVQKTSINPEVKFYTMDSKTFKNASEHVIEFSEKLPYTIEESAKEIIFRVYNPYSAEESVYTINIRKPEKYKYKTILCNGAYKFKVNSLSVPETKTLDGITIVVDAGHGGSERGAIGCLGDKEKDINLSIALELQEILKIMGANVIMTRECDGNVDLEERTNIAKNCCADVFVSIHLDSIGDIKMDIHKNRGTTVYYYNKNSKELAKIVEDYITSENCTKKNGIRTASFAVLRPTEYVGILVETLYMTNPLDSVLYKTENFPRNIAKSIANGILYYFTQEEMKNK